MSTIPDDPNPFAAPASSIPYTAPVKLPGNSKEEAIRTVFIAHETWYRNLRVYDFFGSLLALIGFITLATGRGAPAKPTTTIIWASVDLFVFLGTIILGIACGHLSRWTRWVSVAAFSVVLILCLWAIVGSTISGNWIGTRAFCIILVISLILLFHIIALFSKATTYILSPEYQAIIAATPHIRYNRKSTKPS